MFTLGQITFSAVIGVAVSAFALLLSERLAKSVVLAGTDRHGHWPRS